MTLRIEKHAKVSSGGVMPESTRARAAQAEGDDWGSRIAKLVPAEALGLYGSAAALVTAPPGSTRTISLSVIALIAAGFAIFIRYRSTYDPATKAPQWSAIGISLVSFFLWLLALGTPTSPIGMPADLSFVAPVAALIWGTLLPHLYKGD